MTKKYYINDAANLFNITANKLRFYEEKELIKSLRDENNYRYYTDNEIKQIQIVITYRILGFSIEDIKNLLSDTSKTNHLEHFFNQYKAVNDNIHKLIPLRDSLKEIIDQLYESNSISSKKTTETIKSLNELINIKQSWQDKWNFNSWAKNYDRFVNAKVDILNMYANYDELLSTVYKLTEEKLEKGCSILDIGTGTGNLAKLYFNKGYNIYGVDQSYQMLNEAKKKFPQFPVRLGDFLNLPFSDNSIDIIVSTYAFHHLNEEEKEVSLMEMLRVLKNEGIIVMGDLMFESEEKKIDLFKTLSQEQIAEINDEFYTDIDKLAVVAKKLGKTLSYYKIDYINFVIKIK